MSSSPLQLPAGEMEAKWMMTIRRSRYIGLGRWSSIHDGLVRSLARSVDFNFGQVTTAAERSPESQTTAAAAESAATNGGGGCGGDYYGAAHTRIS